MSAKEAEITRVDIDPGWYPGQPELQDEFQEAPLLDEELDGRLQAGEGQGGCSSGAGRSDGGLPGPGPPLLLRRPAPAVPTVLTKLQKWGDYVSVGSQVLPTKFIPMKTPLSSEILDSWSLPSQPKHRLTVPEMVAQQAALGRKVGLLLDLSNHDCLYTADIPPDLRYTHIQLVAKELPPPEFVDTVVAVANKFWRAHPDEYIAVHCAYGFNRTGFVVCCYLIECCGLSVEDALAAFAESRPPGVKHEAFRAELHRRYDYLNGGGTAVQYGIYGSPDDNSSFGCSPSCASLDLRDLGMGPSPLVRGATFDCLLAAAAGGGGGGVVVGGSGAPVVCRRSLDGHQTLTFTTASCSGGVSDYRRGSNSGGGGLLGGAGALRLWHQHQLLHQQHHSYHHLQPLPEMRSAGQEEQQPAGPQQGRKEQHQAQRHHQQNEQQGQQPPPQQQQQQQGQPWRMFGGLNGGSAVVANAAGEGCSSGRSTGPPEADVQVQVEVPCTGPSGAAVGGLAAGSPRRRKCGAGEELEPQCSLSNENESLGVNDRLILQTMRQHALAQTNGTIPEEAASSHSTPIRGSSCESLADVDNATGQSTPQTTVQRTGRYSHKSLDTIDWTAAAGDDTEAGGIGSAGGNCAGPPAGYLAALKLGSEP